jgi:hypothetical protein
VSRLLARWVFHGITLSRFGEEKIQSSCAFFSEVKSFTKPIKKLALWHCLTHSEYGDLFKLLNLKAIMIFPAERPLMMAAEIFSAEFIFQYFDFLLC